MAKKASDVPTKWDEKSNDETIFPWGKKDNNIEKPVSQKGWNTIFKIFYLLSNNSWYQCCK